ncbi:MAG: hypothetical protein ACYSWU_26075, partial [Planctomycetota bacterium]
MSSRTRRGGAAALCLAAAAMVLLVTSAALTQSGPAGRAGPSLGSAGGGPLPIGPALESGLPNPSLPDSVFSFKGPGADFIKGGETTRTTNSIGVPGQTCPFRMTAQPLPALPPAVVP